MSSSRTLVLASLCRLELNASPCFSGFRLSTRSTSLNSPLFPSPRFLSSFLCSRHYITPLPIHTKPSSGRFYSSLNGAFAIEGSEFKDEEPNPSSKDLILEIPPDSCSDKVEELLSNSSIHKEDEISKLMKMERNLEFVQGKERWFPYLDKFKAGNGAVLSSGEVLEALSPYLMDSRKERFRNAVGNRSYSVCLVVEGLCDFGNVSAAFRSADALGFQSVHVVSCDSSKRYRDNRHVSMGAEKWLDIELWDSTRNCFEVLKSRGYRIATTHLGTDAVSIYDMDWSRPIAIVVGNEGKGISEEALRLSDLHCSIPMKGMVDSFNVSVAAGILMHHAVCDRISRLGSHGDLTSEESQILLAEFFLRHNQNTISIVNEYAKRKIAVPMTSSKM